MSRKIYQNLSSTTLFNFTDTFEHLLSNLENGFYCCDIYEKLPLKGKIIGYKVPMVCFCDIPLGQIKQHLAWYGNYAIGVKRDFARKHKTNPVWYISSDNPVINAWNNSTDRKLLKESPVLPYLKRFIGTQKNLNGVSKPKKFYDEREWRFIPNASDMQAVLMVGGKILDNEKLVENNKRITSMPIDLSQVEYIIVETEEDKENLFMELKRISESKNVRYETLISSILTSNQIMKDF